MTSNPIDTTRPPIPKPHMKDAEEYLAWLKKTAADDEDNARIVGFEDCLRSWKDSELIRVHPTPDIEQFTTIHHEAKEGAYCPSVFGSEISGVDDKFRMMMIAHLDGVYMFTARGACDALVTRLINLVLKPMEPVMSKQPIETAPKGIPVLVTGGIAMQKTGGEWFTGMEEPRYERPLQWQPKWWMPIPTDMEL